MAKTLFLFPANMFDKRLYHGISKLYQIFCVKFGFNLKIVNLEFLSQYMPENSFQILIIAGGDGTIHKVINTIPVETFGKYIFGIIPAGTANEFAKSLSIPKSLEEAANLIINPKNIVRQNLGIINKEYKFTTGFLYGIPSHVLCYTPTIAKHYLGPAAFYLGLLIFLIKFSRTSESLLKKFRANSRKFRTNYLLINNISLISKDIIIRDIEDEDGHLFSLVYLHSGLSALDILRIAFKSETHRPVLRDPALYYEQLNQIILEFEGELNFSLDGEPYKLPSPIYIEHFDRSIRVITG